MFGVYFGKFLLDEGVLTKEQYQDIIETNRNARLKLGPLAINEGFMTAAQAEEINAVQAVKDVRFGDIAIEKRYLTEEQLELLLKKQGDSYLLFIKALTEREILNQEEIKKYLNKFKRAEGFTAYEMEALKSSDIDRIIPLFTKDPGCPVMIQDYVALIARNFIRFIDNKVRFERIERVNQYAANFMAAQEMSGNYRIFAALCSDGHGTGLLKFASLYANETFCDVDEDVLDAVGEFINVSNGLFATKLSEEDVELDMHPPVMKLAPSAIRSDSVMYRLPFFVMGEEVDLIICMEAKWNIE